jgi:hypothetical protein
MTSRNFRPSIFLNSKHEYHNFQYISWRNLWTNPKAALNIELIISMLFNAWIWTCVQKKLFHLELWKLYFPWIMNKVWLTSQCFGNDFQLSIIATSWMEPFKKLKKYIGIRKTAIIFTIISSDAFHCSS